MNARQIDLEAAAWVARSDRGLLPAEETAFDAWFAADPRCQGAYAKARAVFLHSQRAQALGSGYRPESFLVAGAEPALSRRHMLQAGVGAVAAGLAGAVAIGITSLTDRYTAGRGEVRIIPLPDGSVVTLNTNSVIAVRYSTAKRDIRLVRGEALFDVVPDKARPFLVEVGDTVARAVGTVFSVSRLENDAVRVLVSKGLVEVSEPGGTVTPRLLATNMRAITGGNDLRVSSGSAEDVDRELAWRDGLIAFHGETLSEAVEAFARYSDTRISIVDPAVAQERVTGLFRTNDPVGFSKAAAAALNLHVDIGNGEVRLTR